MKRNNFAFTFTIALFALFLSNASYSDQTIINNNGAPATQEQSCNPNAPTDPRVPPPGAYTVNTGNGSSQQVYTTGETKPYMVDPCNNNNSPVIQPYVNAPVRPFRR